MSDRYQRPDPEIESLLNDDPELLALANRVRQSRPEPALDPRFRAVLRAQLMREAQAVLVPKRRRWFAPRMGHLAWGSGALGLALVAALVLVLRSPAGPDQLNVITASSPVAEQHAVSPSDVITVSFSQPMNTAAVQHGLKLQPAARVTLSWSDNNRTLAIHPAHPLAGNTSYAVTIAKDAAQSAAGQKSASDIKITFGTRPTPAPASPPTATPGPPRLVPTALGPVDAGSQVFFGPGAEPGSSSSTATASAPATPAAGNSATPTPASTPGSHAVLFPNGATARVLGGASSAVAYSPSGVLASAVVRPDGGSDITVIDSQGSPTLLTTTRDRQRSLAWADGGTNPSIVYVDQGAIRSIGLDHQTHVLLASVPAGATVVLAPDGRYALVFPAAGATVTPSPAATASPATATVNQDGILVDLRTHGQRSLAGSGSGIAAFSGDGGTVAWIDATRSAPRLMESSSASDTTHPQPAVAALPDHISFIVLSHDAGLIAYAGQKQLEITGSDGKPVATDGAAAAIAFSADSTRVAYVQDTGSGPGLLVAPLPGTGTTKPVVAVPAAAHQALAAFVDAQVQHNTDSMAALSVVDAGALTKTPSRLSRGYVISESLNADQSVSATARLILDPGDGTSDTRLSDESLTVSHSGDAWRVTDLAVPGLQTQSGGPHVLQVQATDQPGGILVSISFDADLQPDSVRGALTLTGSGGAAVSVLDVHYAPDTRTATLTLPAVVADTVTLHIDTSLTDINGGSLAAPFKTTLTV